MQAAKYYGYSLYIFKKNLHLRDTINNKEKYYQKKRGLLY